MKAIKDFDFEAWMGLTQIIAVVLTPILLALILWRVW
jgi:hypothetical protein